MADIVKTVKNEMTFEKILATAMHTPGVKINREKLAENEIPANVDYSTANLIEFTQDKSVGIYGFLRSIDINEES